MRRNSSGSDSLFGLILALLVVSGFITLLTDDYLACPLVVVGIIVGLMAVGTINR